VYPEISSSSAVISATTTVATHAMRSMAIATILTAGLDGVLGGRSSGGDVSFSEPFSAHWTLHYERGGPK
jgi:hypothetical protein